MSITARFYISSYEKIVGNYHKVRLTAVTRGRENAVWAYYSASGSIEMNVRAGSPAAAWFEENVGKDVRIDFSLRPEGELVVAPEFNAYGETVGYHYIDGTEAPMEDEPIE